MRDHAVTNLRDASVAQITRPRIRAIDLLRR
jgi:hypothetical protein